jgi:hypothetical protein
MHGRKEIYCHQRRKLNVMQIYGFMHRVGSLKNMPATWQDMFFPEVHGLKGD